MAATYPYILYESRAKRGSTTASTETTGYPVANLDDWRTFNKWKPTALPATATIDVASLAYEFTASADGWTASGATLTPGATALNVASTGTAPIIRSPSGLTIDGEYGRYIVARLKRNAGSGWNGDAYYRTTRHDESASYTKAITDPTTGAGGAYVLAIWDMHALDAGVDDWKKSAITQFRLDLGNTATDDFDIDWIIITDSLSADYALFWGHDLGTQGVTVEIHGSADGFSADDNTVTTYDPEGDDPFVLYWTAAQYRYWQIKIVAGYASAVPSIGIGVIGSKFQIPAYLPIGWDPVGRTPMGVINRSVKGSALGRVTEYELFSSPVQFEFVTWDWLRDTWRPAWKDHLGDNPFVLTWEKDSYQNELHLVEATTGYKGPHRPGALASLSFNIMGLAND